MPANEQTWRNIPLLHRVFAISGVAMFIATIWVFWADQNREWRTTQTQVVDVDTQMIKWRELQYQTDDAQRGHEEKQRAKLRADAAAVDPAKTNEFALAVDRFNAKMDKLDADLTASNDPRISGMTDSFRLKYDKEATDALQKEQAKKAAEVNSAWLVVAEKQKAAEKAASDYLEIRNAAKAESDENVVAARGRAEAAQTEANDAERDATARSKVSAADRARLIARLDRVVNSVRIKERLALDQRKFKSAEWDAAKARVDIAIRDGAGGDSPRAQEAFKNKLAAAEVEVNDKKAELDGLNLNYQAKNEARLALQKIVAEITADQAAAAKDLETANADLAALEKAYAVREEPYFVTSRSFPWIYPGKGLLNLPVLNAFNPPQKIENLWSAGLMQNYSHAMVRRFDRCTTCHQLMQRSLPGQPQDPAYIHERDLVMWLTPPEKVIEETGDDDIRKLERTYGMRIAPQGLVKFDDVTVSLVLPKTPAARAEVETASSEPVLSENLRENVAKFNSAQTEAVNFKILPGLLVGDVIVEVEDAKADRGATSVAKLLLDAVGSNKPVRLTVRRGLGNPYTTHPRLDLFAGDASPHPMGTFGCTVCHEGQGNATAFKWVSHMPNDGEDDPDQSKRWAGEHGWFDNHHWIYPMWPKRFQESGCLKCHHEVVELEPSEKFPDPPAPKLTHGYHLIRKYGCYGCHDINGFDGPRKRVGPDLRTEPNFYAAALQIGHLMAARLTDLEQAQKAAHAKFEEMHDGDAGTEDEQKAKSEQAAKLEAEVNRLTQHVSAASRALELAPQVASRSYDGTTRTELYQLFTADAAIKDPAQRAFDVDLHRTAAVLKDVEAPGSLRKPGPTLRYVREKDDPVFLYDWIANPKNFRPDTRMPQFFGLHKHLQPEPKSIDQSHRLEPVEIHGLVKYLEHNSQEFVPLEKPEGIVDDPRDERVARGKMLFETRGCLACHEHHDFPKAKEYRGKDEIVQGPELSAIAQKFDAQRNPKGREWLYSWIKNPTRYNVRTLMPNLFLEPLEERRPTGAKDENGELRKDAAGNPETKPVMIDPAADIVEYLLDPAHIARANPQAAEADSDSDNAVPSHEHNAWHPVNEAHEGVDPVHLKELVIEYLRDSFHESRLEEYYENGLPERMRPELKVAEQDLLVAPGETLTDEQRLLYIGRKTVSKFGCYGCHDVPGFEDAKPIGTGLADWGRKDPSRLAFEHISHYLEHGHGDAATHGADSDAAKSRENISLNSGTVGSRVNPEDPHASDTSAAHQDELPVYYERALSHGNRVGFIYQKLREPRSYDFEKTENKKYNDRLRMPEFPFNIEEREAVITFVLGLVAEPPTEKYVYKPSERDRTIIAGKQVLETFNCGGCHILDAERWKLSAPPEIFGDPSPPKTFPFALHSLDPSIVGKSATTDRRGMVEAELRGLPSQEASGENGALPVIRDPDDADFEAGEKAQPRLAKYEFALFQNASAVGGDVYQPGTKLMVPGANLARKYPTQGGYLTKYLSPVVYDLERKTNPNAKGDQVLGWLPPPLMGEGKKVQTAWLYDFLMEPYMIRPATFLRMPKFNLSPDDTSKLVAYFAAKDNASYPYEFDRRRQADHLSSAQADYAKKAEKAGATENLDRLEASLKTVTNRTYCVQCHSVADFVSDNTPRAQGPNLAQVYKRLRPDYVRRWIAYPTLTLPYTAMPENIKYDPDQKQVSDEWFHGTRTEQVDGLVDLLMNFDEYAKRQTRIAELVPPPAKTEDGKTEAGAEAPAETGAR